MIEKKRRKNVQLFFLKPPIKLIHIGYNLMPMAVKAVYYGVIIFLVFQLA